MLEQVEQDPSAFLCNRGVVGQTGLRQTGIPPAPPAEPLHHPWLRCWQHLVLSDASRKARSTPHLPGDQSLQGRAGQKLGRQAASRGSQRTANARPPPPHAEHPLAALWCPPLTPHPAPSRDIVRACFDLLCMSVMLFLTIFIFIVFRW